MKYIDCVKLRIKAEIKLDKLFSKAVLERFIKSSPNYEK